VPPVSKLAWKLTDQWTKQLHLLLLRMQDPRDCLEFARYHENSWMPPFWKWAEATPGLDSIALEELLADPEYDSYYSHAASGAPLYGSPAVETVWRPQGRFRRKRIQELQHFRILRRAAGIDLRSLTHVVEFGGGVGETVAALSDLGFSGRHLVIDLPPMLLLQRYWLRYSGLPAYLAKDLPRNNSQDERPLGRTGVLLHSALAAPHAALRHLADAKPETSLFVAFWSFTEADPGAREKVWPLLERCGIVMLTFGNIFDGVDNVAYLQKELSSRGFDESHHALSWHLASSTGHYYMIAVRKEVGSLTCLPELNCHNTTRHARVVRWFSLSDARR